MEEISMKQHALNYGKRGLEVGPVVKNRKMPFGNVSTSNVEQIDKWWTQNSQFNIGIKTGKGSGIIVLSFNTQESFEEAEKHGLPLTPIATNGKGFDVYFKYQEDVAERFDTERFPGIKISGYGASVLAPPSIVNENHSPFSKPEVYSWCEGKKFFDVPLADVPSWMLKTDHAEIVPLVEETPIAQVEEVADTIEQDHDDQLADVVAVEHVSAPVVIEPSNDNKSEPVANEWKVPKLFDRYPVEEIEADVLPLWLGDFAKAISESKQTPEGLAVMLGLSMIATCVQKKFVVAPNGHDEYTEQLALWTVTVLKSGERKSPVLSALREPLNAWQKEQAVLLKDRIIETSTAISVAQKRIDKLHQDAAKMDDATERQSIIDKITEIKKGMPVEVKAPVLWTSDITAEELEDKLAEYGERMAVLSAEGNIFEVMGGLYSDKVNIDVFLQSYSGESTRIDRRSRKAELNNPALTFGMAVQPTVVESFAKGAKSQFRDKGALARFLYCIPEPMVGQRDTDLDAPVPEQVKARYQAGIKRLLSIPTPDVPQILTLEKEAFKAYKNFDRKVEKMLAPSGELEDMGDWGAKLPGNMLRVAGLMHLVEHGPDSTVIDKDTLDKAVHLCELLIEHAKAAFGMAGAIEPSSDAKKVFEWIRVNEFNAFTKTDCHQQFKSKPWNKEKLDIALTELVKRHIIKPVQEITSGRTATHYISNPALK